jgi:Predicted membrane protein (DUF2306)
MINIEKRCVIIHRINGYSVLLLLISGTVSGTIAGRPAYGGELSAQSGFYVLGSMIVFAAIMGYSNVKKDTREHRKWMLRELLCPYEPSS